MKNLVKFWNFEGTKPRGVPLIGECPAAGLISIVLCSRNQAVGPLIHGIILLPGLSDCCRVRSSQQLKKKLGKLGDAVQG